MAVSIIPKPHTPTEEERAASERKKRLVQAIANRGGIRNALEQLETEVTACLAGINDLEEKIIPEEANTLRSIDIKNKIDSLNERLEILYSEKEKLTRDLNEKEQEITSIQAEEASKNFDKKTCLENIRYLLSQKPVKLGEIEREAKVSPGYLSRLEKEGNTTDPSIEFLITAAQKLEISLDTLVKTKLSRLTVMENELIHFLAQLKNDADTDELFWAGDSITKLDSYESMGLEQTTVQPHPLYQVIVTPDGPENYAYHSEFFPELPITPVDTCYHTRLQETADELYLMKVCEITGIDTHGDVYIELYHVEASGIVHPICNSLQAPKDISNAVNELYESAAIAATHVRIEKETRSLISSYLGSKTIRR